MALYVELRVYKATYELLLAIFRFTKDFGKEYKYTVGERLKKETIEKNQRNAIIVYVAIAGDVVNVRSTHLRNFVLNGRESASNSLLHIHPKPT
jgi:hypothetical protein